MKFIKSTILVFSVACIAFAFTYAESDIKPAIGDQAPEIAMPDQAGNIAKLSSLKGHVVLIDFWASWCRSCRVENTNYTAAYNKFKGSNFKDGKGFEIFSVSLDKDSEAWKKAITNDRLVWKNHVTDLKKWNSPVVADYNFKYLPHNLVIDGTGKVIAKGLFGDKLDEFLTSRLAD
jgi:peroxiredoxin